MTPTDLAVQEAAAEPSTRRIVNDFSIQVATVNGSGSQTANLVLLRSIFQMGIPVSGKNMFPSNIAGLPTWYTIRANHRGYIGRKKEIDFLVAMNPETAREDVLSLEPGRSVVYDEPLKLNALRSDLIFYPVPFDKLVAMIQAQDPDGRAPVALMIPRGRSLLKAQADFHRPRLLVAADFNAPDTDAALGLAAVMDRLCAQVEQPDRTEEILTRIRADI